MITKWSENSIELSIEKIGSFGSGRLSVVFCNWLSTPSSGTDGKRWPRSTLGSLPAKGDSSPPEYRFPKGRNKPAPMGNLLRLQWRVTSAFDSYLDELVSCFASF